MQGGRRAEEEAGEQGRGRAIDNGVMEKGDEREGEGNREGGEEEADGNVSAEAGKEMNSMDPGIDACSEEEGVHALEGSASDRSDHGERTR